MIVCDASLTSGNLGKEKPLVYMGKHGNYTWPRRDLAVSIDGGIILGALHMVHERSEDRICGPIMPQGGIQALETMLYTLDWINDNKTLLPGIKLGILAKDDCDRDIYGMEQAVDFIRGMACLYDCYYYYCYHCGYVFSFAQYVIVKLVLSKRLAPEK